MATELGQQTVELSTLVTCVANDKSFDSFAPTPTSLKFLESSWKKIAIPKAPTSHSKESGSTNLYQRGYDLNLNSIQENNQDIFRRCMGTN